MITEKRVQADLEEMTKHPIEGIAVIPRDENIGIWQIFVEGTKVSVEAKAIRLLRCIFLSDGLFSGKSI
jgi:ubiquitin-protein ligase